MIVRVGDLQPEGLSIDRSIQIGPLSMEGGLEIGVAEARLKALLTPDSEGLLCAGRIQATAMVPCSRCLEPYALHVDREFDLSYQPGPSAAAAEPEVQIAAEDLDVAYLDPEGILDVGNLAAEQIYLEIPMKPLCSPDCKGLCPGCGANLNTEPCTCSR
ncbi:MAG TPA: DUF177 domain-containing protein [Candidatus Polarisedimenticolia bacterium]|nr:DUF177 domain-containing protein [Candidatus Polarisedimenticolia bacterium]